MKDKMKELSKKIESIVEEKTEEILKSKKLDLEKSEVKEIIEELLGDLDDLIAKHVKKHFGILIDFLLTKDEDESERKGD